MGIDPPRNREHARTPLLHEQVKRQLSENILLGRWSPGTVIPGEASLAETFGVAVGTVRRALAGLVAEGMLTRRPKLGTVVTGRAPDHSLRFFFQYFRLHGADGRLLQSSVANPQIDLAPADPRTAAELLLAPGEPVLQVRRVRLVEGKPVMRDRYTIASSRVPGFPTTPAGLPDLFYQFLLSHYGWRITAVREHLHADLADAEDARELHLSLPTALLVIDAIAYDQAGAPLVLVQQRASTRAHLYVNEVR
jgi:GntR family transcriptional regulator